MVQFNPLAFTENLKRMCENLECSHYLSDHSTDKCEKCNCEKFVKSNFRICISFEDITYCFKNFIDKKCPSCETDTHMMEMMSDHHTIDLPKATVGSKQLDTAIHNCKKCGLISFYEVEGIFDQLLRKLIFRDEIKKRIDDKL